MEPVIIKTESLSKQYKINKMQVPALKNVNLELRQGEFVSIAGPSGSGKTTLFNLIGCLDRPSSGKVYIEGQDVARLAAGRLAEIRREKIGFVFQTFNLIQVLSVYENIEYPLLLQGRAAAEIKEKVHSILQEVHLGGFATRYPNELSGGQQQRVAIARALVIEPLVVLADEPTANLDSKTGEAIINLMLEINQKDGVAFFFSTHDPMVMELASRLIEIHDGEIL